MNEITDIRDLRWPDPMPTEDELCAKIAFSEINFAVHVVLMLVDCVEVKHWGPLQEFIDYWWGGEK